MLSNLKQALGDFSVKLHIKVTGQSAMITIIPESTLEEISFEPKHFMERINDIDLEGEIINHINAKKEEILEVDNVIRYQKMREEKPVEQAETSYPVTPDNCYQNVDNENEYPDEDDVITLSI